MSEPCLKLTTYFGERDRANGRATADALLDVYGRHRLRTSLLLRGIEGFGRKHRLQTARLLTLSEDLPLVSVAVDTRERIEAALGDVLAVKEAGLVTLERARMLSGRVDFAPRADRLHDETKLTIYLGRQERIGRRPAFVAVTELLHDAGVAGATTLLGVDGTAHGERERARFLSRNAEVPMMLISVGAGERFAAVLPRLGELLPRPLMSVERVRVLKRDGARLATPDGASGRDAAGRDIWQKLMVFAGEQTQHGGHALYPQLVRRLREAGADGATALRGIWGYHGAHAPHGDRLLAVRRHVPVVTIAIDTPERIAAWWPIVDELTEETGLVTSELVPAARVVGPEGTGGGLALADTP